jgi:hypothetical protein
MESGRSRFTKPESVVKVTVVFAVELAKESKFNKAVSLSEFSNICIEELSSFEDSVEEYEKLGI